LTRGILTIQVCLQEEKLKIIAYEFYFRDPIKGYQLVGILPEKRKDPKRTNTNSIRKLGKTILGKSRDSKDLFFTKVMLDTDTGRIIHSNDFHTHAHFFPTLFLNQILRILQIGGTQIR